MILVNPNSEIRTHPKGLKTTANTYLGIVAIDTTCAYYNLYEAVRPVQKLKVQINRITHDIEVVGLGKRGK